MLYERHGRVGAVGVLTGTESLAGLRYLDVDDLYLMSLLSKGFRLVDAARQLSLTQPAITQRIHKIEQALKIVILDRSIRGTRLSQAGVQACQCALDAVAALEKISRTEHLPVA